MHKCIKCKIELTDENWYLCQKKIGSKICIECKLKIDKRRNRKSISHIYKKRYVPFIPTLCKCGCGKVVWNHHEYIMGHWMRERNLKNNPMKKLIGDKNHSWKGGLPKCEICREKLSDYVSKRCKKCTDHKGINNPMFGKLGKLSPAWGKTHGRRWGKGNYYKNIYFRSSWELEFAKFLDSINEPWDYECRTFDLETTTYTPDFYLPNRNLWIEIKGWWRPGYKEKFDTFLAKYPEENMKLIMHKPPYMEEDLNI